MRTPRLLVLAVSLVGFAACSDSTAPEDETLVLELVSGDEQTFIAGLPPADSIVVRVVGIDGDPQSGVSVVWRIARGGGYFLEDGTLTQLTVMEVVTDGAGLAAVGWTLGNGSWEQALEVSAGHGELAIEVVAEPLHWRDVLTIPPSVRISDDQLHAQVRVVNEWGHTARLQYDTGGGCLAQSQLYTISGEPVDGWVDSHCLSGRVITYDLGSGSALHSATWQIAMSRLEPGLYAIVIRFNDTLEVNGRLADLPDVTLLHVVE